MRLIGINGGGKNTEAVLFDENGRILNYVRGEASSQISVSDEVPLEHLGIVLERLTGSDSGRIDHVFAGISGSMENRQRHDHLIQYLKQRFPDAERIAALNDATNAFRSIAHDGDGITANASTGSSVFYISGDTVGQIGGWGYIFGDEGSAYDLGRRAIRAALRAKDGRGSSTKLTGIIDEMLGRPLTDALNSVYEGGRQKVAEFSKAIFTAVKQNDATATRQLEESARQMAEAITAAGRKLNCSLIRVALSGHLWEEKAYYNAVDQIVGKTCQLIIPSLPKCYGAAVQALALSGKAWTKSFEKNFSESLSGFAK